MTISRKVATDIDLEDADIGDAVRSYISLEARRWQRAQRNRVMAPVFRLVDGARDRGDKPDVNAIIKMVFLDRTLPLPELE